MFPKKKMLLKNSKKFKKHMLYYLMKIKENNMINMDIVHLPMVVADFLDLMALTLEICLMYLMIFLEDLASEEDSQVQKVTVGQKQLEEMMFYTI
jgi:hypothetical protein